VNTRRNRDNTNNNNNREDANIDDNNEDNDTTTKDNDNESGLGLTLTSDPDNDDSTVGSDTASGATGSPQQLNLNKNTDKQDFSYYFIIAGVGSFIILIAWFLLKSDEDEGKDKENTYIKGNTICYPYTPKAISDVLNPKELKHQ